MKTRSFKRLSVAAVVLIAMFALARAVRAQSYTYTTLEVPNAVSTNAYGINDTGDIVGCYTDSSGGSHGFLYSGGKFTTIDVPGGVGNTIAYGVNDYGVIVGTYSDSNGNQHGFKYNVGTRAYTRLDDPSGYSTNPWDIDDSGDIVGSYYANNGNENGFLYSGTTYTTIDDPKVNEQLLLSGTIATGINDSRDIVGYYQDSSYLPVIYDEGFLDTGGAYTTLDDPSSFCATNAIGINNTGDIVGYYYDSSGNYHGFLYTGSAYTTLDDPSGVGNTYAYGINDSGDIVGYYTDSSGNSHGFLATPPGLWQNAVSTGAGWYYLSPFGSFYPTSASPWIYHQTLGWLCPYATSTASIWFWDPQWNGTGGWWWSSSSFFPWIYSASENEWFYYDAANSSPGARWFWNSGTGWTTH